jgi:hypothetical protein
MLNFYSGWFDWPLRLVWLTGLARAPGGGQLVATTMLLTIVADIFEADERYVTQ